MNTDLLLGLTAACCTTASFVPQAIKTIRTKDTKDISLLSYIFLTVGGIVWLIYGIKTMNVPVIATNSVSLVLAGIILILKLMYK